MLTLYHGWRSSASRRVRLFLAEKGLTFESRIVDLVKGEHHSPEYLKLNPNGVIPLLILDDGRSLYESGTICEYIDETWPEPPLRPATDQAAVKAGLKDGALDAIAKDRAQALLADHRRVREAAEARGTYQVTASLPVDIMGVYVLVPAAAGV